MFLRVTTHNGQEEDLLKIVFGGFDKLPDGSGYQVQGEDNIRGNRSAGVATEVYNQIINELMIHCNGLFGKFVELPLVSSNYDKTRTKDKKPNPCNVIKAISQGVNSSGVPLSVNVGDNACPLYYIDTMDTKSWGACLCPEAKDANGVLLNYHIVMWGEKYPYTTFTSNSVSCRVAGSGVFSGSMDCIQ